MKINKSASIIHNNVNQHNFATELEVAKSSTNINAKSIQPCLVFDYVPYTPQALVNIATEFRLAVAAVDPQISEISLQGIALA